MSFVCCRSKELQLLQKKNHLASRKMMDRWLFAMKVVNFRKQARINWSTRCTRYGRTDCPIFFKQLFSVFLLEKRQSWPKIILDIVTENSEGKIK